MSHFLKGLSADKFNQKYPVGSCFHYFSIKGIPDSVEVVTRTEAWALGHGDVVVSVNGRAGGLHIEHMKPIAIADIPQQKNEELSKPVAWTDIQELADMKSGTYGNIFNSNYINTSDGQWMPLYSQEYVSTLITQLEAANEALKGDQVPVAVLYRTGEVLSRAECADDRTFAVCCKVETPLFTASQKPVVRQHHADWSDATFGNVGPVGPLKHLSKEALETAASPGDLSEWADMQFLFWDAQRRAGITDAQIEQAMIDKLEINKSRVWPEPKDGEPREHIKAGFPVEGEIK